MLRKLKATSGLDSDWELWRLTAPKGNWCERVSKAGADMHVDFGFEETFRLNC